MSNKKSPKGGAVAVPKRVLKFPQQGDMLAVDVTVWRNAEGKIQVEFYQPVASKTATKPAAKSATKPAAKADEKKSTKNKPALAVEPAISKKKKAGFDRRLTLVEILSEGAIQPDTASLDEALEILEVILVGGGAVDSGSFKKIEQVFTDKLIAYMFSENEDKTWSLTKTGRAKIARHVAKRTTGSRTSPAKSSAGAAKKTPKKAGAAAEMETESPKAPEKTAPATKAPKKTEPAKKSPKKTAAMETEKETAVTDDSEEVDDEDDDSADDDSADDDSVGDDVSEEDGDSEEDDE